VRRQRLVAVLAVAACCLTLAIGWWSKARCLADGDWTGGEEYLGWCYTDVFPLWWAELLSEGAVPYLDHPVEYPVLTGAQMWLGQQLAQLAEPGIRAQAFFTATAAVNAVLSLGVLGLLAAAGAPARRLWWWALAPALAVYAFLNWDPLAVVALTAAVALHVRGRDLGAGIAAGLGVAAKLIPGVLIPLVVAARLAQGRRRDALRHLVGAAAAWLAVNVPVLLAAPEGWSRFFTLNRERHANYDSLWYLVEQIRGEPFELSTLNALTATAFAATALLAVAVGARRRGPSQWWSLALPVLCALLLTNKVYSPQYTLWILPLAALSLRRLAPYAAFLVADLLLFLVEFPFLGGLGGYGPAPGYSLLAAALLVRAATLVWLLVESTLDHDPSLTAGATAWQTPSTPTSTTTTTRAESVTA
jgi:Glycosyltransferase family 87